MVNGIARAVRSLVHPCGLGSCWIGLAQDWLATPEGKTAIGAPATSAPVAPIIVGYPEYEPTPVPRREPEIIWIG